jgi:hypothetical protein
MNKLNKFGKLDNPYYDLDVQQIGGFIEFVLTGCKIPKILIFILPVSTLEFSDYSGAYYFLQDWFSSYPQKRSFSHSAQMM